MECKKKIMRCVRLRVRVGACVLKGERFQIKAREGFGFGLVRLG